MPVLVYQLARELNRPARELLKRSEAQQINSVFSTLQDDVEKALRKAFSPGKRNPCLDREKPKVKRARPKKPKAKHEANVEESGELLGAAEGLEGTDAGADSAEVASSGQEGQTAEAPSNPREGVAATSAGKQVEKLSSSSLGKVGHGTDADFQIGRILDGQGGVAVDPGATPRPGGRRKIKRTLEERLDSTVSWDQNHTTYIPEPLPKKNQTETSGSRLQRMQLVYGHEIPKKDRERITDRSKVEMDESIVVPINLRDLSEKLGVRATDVIKYLMSQGNFVTITDTVDMATCEAIAKQFEVDATFTETKTSDEVVREIAKSKAPATDLKPRPPVVTIMGHVDHGKTTLLDAIRDSKLTEMEHGGITQHIGGYQVEKNGRKITFLDTPGHAAFTAIRARGAKITDIVILVVAADDGVMPQTEEAVNHARAAKVPIVVAINKMDKAGAKPDKIKEKLATMELIPEEWSGKTAYVGVSALKGEGIDQLLEMLLLQTDMLELRARYDGLAEGVVIEAHQEPGRGVVISLLVRGGILKKGDAILCGQGYGFVRQMEDEDGKIHSEAEPSRIVKIMGLSECPMPGDMLNVMPNIRQAKDMAAVRSGEARARNLQEKQVFTLESFMDKIGGQQASLENVIVKADTQGSAEAIEKALSELGNEEVKVKLIHRGVGSVSESDVLLAKTSGARILAFNVTDDARARRMAQDENIEIKKYRIIYEMLDDINARLEGLLKPEQKEESIGEVEIRQVFRISHVGVIAGSYVTKGYAERGSLARLIRDGNVIYTGKVHSLRRFKDDVKRVEQRYECGIRLENYEDIHEGDVVELYMLREIKRTL